MNLYPRPVFTIWHDKVGYHWRQFWLIGPNGSTDGKSQGSGRAVTIQQCRSRQVAFQNEHPNGVTHDLTNRVFINGGMRR